MNIDDWLKSRSYLCPLCEEGTMSLQFISTPIGNYFNQDIQIRLQYWECDVCRDGFDTDLGGRVIEAAFKELKTYMEKNNDHKKTI